MLTQEQGGLFWPTGDQHCFRVASMELNNLDRVIARCLDRGIAVQAGGNVGVFAKHLAAVFAAVYTFEPDAENFHCLVRNVVEPNVVKIQSALGFNRKLVDLERASNNVGAHAVKDGGIIPVLRIDDLALPSCGLIYLDVEGYELEALHGAFWTIKQYAPVIAFEDKGLGKPYGSEQGDCAKYLAQFNYRVIDQVGNDVVCIKPTL